MKLKTLRRVRRLAGLSIRRLGVESTVNAGHISRVERGVRVPTLKVMALLAAALHTSIEKLFPDVLAYYLKSSTRQVVRQAARLNRKAYKKVKRAVVRRGQRKQRKPARRVSRTRHRVRGRRVLRRTPRTSRRKPARKVVRGKQRRGVVPSGLPGAGPGGGK